MTTDRASSPRSDETLPPGTRIGAVVSGYHAELTGAMRDSARARLVAAGLAEEDFLELAAPGAFELPLIARRLAVREDVAAVLCFGLVLKGETPHDVYISQATSEGILRVSLETDKPILFGVLTCDTLEQARARALPDGEHDKGREVAEAALVALAAMRAAPTIGLGGDKAMGFGAPEVAR